MASGFGAFSPTGRCTHLWNSFTACMSECASPEECKLKKADYLECLSNKKTYTKVNALNQEQVDQHAAQKQEFVEKWRKKYPGPFGL